jgi:hypothetical protein
LPEIFPLANAESGGYLYLSAPDRLLFTEFRFKSESQEAIKAINPDKFAGIKQVFSPLLGEFLGWKTTLNLINANPNEADVTITIHDSDGVVIVPPFRKHFAAGEQLVEDLSQIFPEMSHQGGAGWLEIASTRDQILGTMKYQGEKEGFAASCELSGTPLDRFLIPIVSQNETYETRLALLNRNSDAARVTVELWDTEGKILRSREFTLQPYARDLLSLKQFFGGMAPLQTGNLRVQSNKSLYGISFLQDSKSGLLMLMPALPSFQSEGDKEGAKDDHRQLADTRSSR